MQLRVSKNHQVRKPLQRPNKPINAHTSDSIFLVPIQKLSKSQEHTIAIA